MRIVIDFQAAQSIGSRNRGIGRYCNSLVKEIIRNRGSHDIIIVLNGLFSDSIESIQADFEGLLPQKNIIIWHTVASVSFNNTENDWRRKTAELTREAFLASLKPDMVVASSLFEGLCDDAVTSIGNLGDGIPTAMILYDLIPLIYSKIYLKNPIVEKWYNEKLDYMRRADLLLAISESSRQEAIHYLGILPQKVVTISSAADAQFHPVTIDTGTNSRLFERYGIKRSFIMYTGGIDYRKNIEGLIRAYARFPKALIEKHQLVVICSIQPASRKELEILAFQHGLQPEDLVLTGFVPDQDLFLLYNLCKVFVFPSFHEGFGLPVLEAMSCGRAVIGANTSSLPEVIEREDALFDPRNDQSITDKLVQVLTDDSFRISLERHGIEQAKKFSWEKSAVRTLSAIENWETQQLNKKSFFPIASTLPKLAFLSPLPPERSGISDYSAELLPELANYYEIDVVVDQTNISDAWIKSNCGIRSYDWFKTNAKTYDRVIYHFGNSPFHRYMFSFLDNIPGVVVLHDFYLSHIINYLEDIKLHPHALLHSLYQSHGYLPFNTPNFFKNKSKVVWDYPCNLDVLQNAVGVIVHSQHSCDLATQYYGKNAAKDWSVIPMLRTSANSLDRIHARNQLNLGVNHFIVCSFGMLGPTKFNKRLLDSWLASSISKDENCILIFVGENPEGQYGNEMAETIKKSGISHRIQITGWIDLNTFRRYLAAADLSVQLRTLSRGETSAAILDCLNYGLTTIVNSNGSIAELSEDVVVKIPDEFKDSELIQALETLWKDEKRRKNIATHARDYIRNYHSPEICAKMYAQSIESFYQQASKTKSGLIHAIARLDKKPKNDTEVITLATCLSQNFPACPRQKQLLIDVSELCQGDARSGIQRVVRAILIELLHNPPDGYRVEPVYATTEKPYHYARQFTMRFLNCQNTILTDEPMEYQSGDFFLGLDFQTAIVCCNSHYLQGLNRDGVIVVFMVYDILPVLLPSYFWSGLKEEFENWLQTLSKISGVVCISKSTADDVQRWMAANVKDIRQHFKIGWFHLGADIRSSYPSVGLPSNVDSLLKAVSKNPAFLMVGTIEPRKRHAQTLDAFEELWNDGFDINLVIVGKHGWFVEPLVERLRQHPENNSRLFWFDGISDEYLEKIYGVCTCLLAPSEGEGFGLPLIEAAQFKIPIIARKLPVFREIAGENAFYFDGLDAGDLASAIKEWLSLNKSGKAPKSEKIPFLTWAQSTEQLKDVIFGNKWQHA